MSESGSLVSEFVMGCLGYGWFGVGYVSESGSLVSEFVFFLLFLLSLVGE